MICGIGFVDWTGKLGKGVNELSFWCSDTPQRNWNNIPDLLRAMPVKISVKHGMICN